MKNLHNVPEFPLFYIKAVGGKFSIEHRLTHTIVSTVEDEKELLEEMERLVEMPEEELWRFLLYTRSAKIVLQKDFEKYFDHEEQWYFGAWGMFTAQFYEEHPELYKVVDKLPIETINKIRKEKLDEANAIYKKHRQEVEEQEAQLKTSESSEKKPKKDLVVPADNTVRLGDREKAEKVAKKKKAKRKVIIKKKKKNEVVSLPEIDDNPFD